MTNGRINQVTTVFPDIQRTPGAGSIAISLGSQDEIDEKKTPLYSPIDLLRELEARRLFVYRFNHQLQINGQSSI